MTSYQSESEIRHDVKVFKKKLLVLMRSPAYLELVSIRISFAMSVLRISFYTVEKCQMNLITMQGLALGLAFATPSITTMIANLY